MDTVAVTGGNGKIGEAILRDLVEHGYRAVNVARGSRREEVADEYRRTDLLDAGEVYGSLAAAGADAVIHMGTIPTPTSNPGFRVFESNAMSTYHVLEAATELDLEAVCLASSINVMGGVFQAAPMDVRYLPVDEDHPVTPRDPYAIGKHAIEVTADGFGRRPDAPQVASLRYPWVATESELRERFVDADRTMGADLPDVGARDDLFAYLHIEDGARIARRAVEADLAGHERFWAVADDTSVDVPTDEVVERCFPDAAVRTPVAGHEAIVDTSKAADLLGWRPEHSWRDL
jgi:nucleoside-diphosphate-sugar epimerase